MNREVDAQKQISEIHECLAETRGGWSGGGVIGGVWAVLTLVAILAILTCRPLRSVQPVVWILHNVLGWAFTLTWCHRAWRNSGRVSLRGRLTLRLWAMITLAVWLSVLLAGRADSSALQAFCVAAWLAAGMFVTGLLSESALSQAFGVVWMVAAGACAFFVAQPLATFLLAGSIPVFCGIWAAGSVFSGKRA